MINQNKVFVIGVVTRDPELKALPSGGQVCSLSVATNRTFKKTDGTRGEQAEFHNVVVFGAQAPSTAQFMRKGSQIGITGRLQTRSWDGQDGKKVYRTEIIAEDVQFGSKPTGTATAPATTTADTIEYPDEEINLEDIPF